MRARSGPAPSAILEGHGLVRGELAARGGDLPTACVADGRRHAGSTQDPHEGGLRRILNFGHTIGHALEAETSYRQFLHGEAVAWGMVAASMISAAMQKSDGETARRIISTILAYANLPKVEPRGKKIVRRLAVDKKTVNGMPHFVLPTEIGKVEIVSDVPERAVVQAVDELRYLSLAG